MDERKVSTATEACICTATKKQRLSILGLSYLLDTSESDYVLAKYDMANCCQEILFVGNNVGLMDRQRLTDG